MVHKTSTNDAPDNAGCKSLINLESLYGICSFKEPVFELYESLLITVDKANKDLLINEPSFLLSTLEVAFSDPAKSHKESVALVSIPD